MAEASIASAIAAPYTYKVESNEWILRSETYARIELLGDNTRTQFRIVVLGQVEGRVEVIVNLSLFKEIIYHRSSGLFHQFADKTSLVGLRFPSEEDAARFATSFENVINLLNNPQPNTPLPMPSGYPPTPPVSASMPVSSPLAAGNSFPSSHVDSVFSSSPTPLRTPIQRRDSSSGGDASAFHAGAVTAESRSQLGGRKPLLGANRDVADASPTTPDVGSPPEPQTAAVGKTFVRTTSSTGSSNALLASNPSMRSPSPAVAKVQVSAPKTGASPRAAPALLKASAVPVTPNPEMKLRPSLTGSLPPPPEEFATAPVPPPPVAVVDPAPPALSPLRASPLTDTSSSTMSSLSSDSPLRSSVQSFSSQSFASPNGGSPIASAVSAPANVSPRGTPAAVTPLSPKSVSIAPSAKATPSKPPPLLVPKTAPTTAPAPAPVVTLPPAALTSPSAPQLGTLRHGAQAPSPQTTTIRRNVDQNILTLGLTPGTSAAMEKLEAAEEQTRHRLKIDLSDPRWKAATLFVQLMIECSEQLFPNKGRFVLSTMPKLIKRSLEYLETEAALVENVFLYEYLEKLERLDRLKAYIDKDQDLTKASREQTVHLIAELVKRHCRDIPGQLINLEAYDPTYSFCDMPDDASRLQYIQELVDTLPATSKVVLECVITLLARVHAASSVTKMDAMRLGAVFAPLLLRPQLLEYKRPQPIPLRVRLEL